jgi:hypothetical protein
MRRTRQSSSSCRSNARSQIRSGLSGLIQSDTFSIEINIGTAEMVESVMLHVRGGDDSIGLIADILDRLNVEALDMSARDIQTGEMFDRGTATNRLAALACLPRSRHRRVRLSNSR